MPRIGTRDLAKERYWRGIIQDWISSGKSGAEFCRLHGLKWYLLKGWRKNIQTRDAEIATARRVKTLRSTTRPPVSKAPKNKQVLPQFVSAVITDLHPAKSPASNESTHRIDSSVRHGTAYYADMSAGLSIVNRHRPGESIVLSLSPSVRIFVSTKPVDMRRSFDGLFALVESTIKQDPYSGALFLFKSRRGNVLKALWWDFDGWAIFAKRLEVGTFRFPEVRFVDGNYEPVEIERADLLMLLEGIDTGLVKRLKRYRKTKSEAEQTQGPAQRKSHL